MSLELPADLEPYTTDFRTPAVYTLDITRPDDLAAVWDDRYDTRPAYWDELVTAESVVYVGATTDLLSRLEDHRDGDVRQAVLPTIAVDVSLRNAWPCEDAQEAFERETRIALRLRRHLPETFVWWS